MSQTSSYYAGSNSPPPYAMAVGEPVEEPQGQAPMGTWAAVGLIVVLGVAVAALFIAVANAKQIDASPQVDMVANIEDLMNRDAQVLQDDIMTMQSKSQSAQAALQKELSALRAAQASKPASSIKAPSSKAPSSKAALLHAPTLARVGAPLQGMRYEGGAAPRNNNTVHMSEKRKKHMERALKHANHKPSSGLSPVEALKASMSLDRALLNKGRKQVERNKTLEARRKLNIQGPHKKAEAQFYLQRAKAGQKKGVFPESKH